MGYIDDLTERLVKAKKVELVEAEKQGLEGLDGKKGKDLLTLIGESRFSRLRLNAGMERRTWLRSRRLYQSRRIWP